MRLDLSESWTVTLHFNHSQDDKHRWVTSCNLHEGECKGKPCGIPPEAIGIARCNPIDVFSKKTGRVKSLTRALIDFPRETRKAVWAAYWFYLKPKDQTTA